LVSARGEALHRDLVLRALHVPGHAPPDGRLEAVAAGERHGEQTEPEERAGGEPVHAVAASRGSSVPSCASSRCRAPSATGALTAPWPMGRSLMHGRPTSSASAATTS